MNCKELVAKMTLEEKAGLCSGKDFWQTKAIERLGIPSVMLTDGPHGLRKQAIVSDHLGLQQSVPATCFPAACATGSSYDEALLEEMGQALGDECEAESISALLGPGLNIKRSPLCGRNFEYFSEDPYLSGKMAAAHVRGVQSKNVAACPKHFAVNNQENRRFSQNSIVDERTLREIYLAGFEAVVKESNPWTMMSSYNRVNGEYASRNHRLLTEILRDEWGFDGFVVSDWSATNDRVRCLAAGMELEMPNSGGFTDKEIIAAVSAGTLDEAVLDLACERLLGVILKTRKDEVPAPANKLDAHDDLAAHIAAESAVLLENDGTLPLCDGADVCFVGEFFEKPRIQGGGSSHINAYKITSAREMLPDAPYAKGFMAEAEVCDETLEGEAIALAKAHAVCVVFAGLPDLFESEGYDRSHMELPANQNQLIGKLIDAGVKVVVVLHHGSPVGMPWAKEVSAVLDMYLGGQACGRAAVELLFGKRNPCGKLAETFPLKLSDTPCYPWYNKDADDVSYHEGIFVGYRYYDIKQMDVRYAFGYGLSYTSFEYADLTLDREQTDGELRVSVRVSNVGNVAGKEIVQLYVAAPRTGISRAEKELKGFAKVQLAPGESKVVEIVLDRRAFAYYNVAAKDFFVEAGEYQILIGKSSREIVLCAGVRVESADKLPLEVSRDTLLGDLMKYPQVAMMFQAMMSQSPLGAVAQDKESGLATMFQRMIRYMPLRALSTMGVSPEQLQGIIAQIKGMIGNQ